MAKQNVPSAPTVEYSQYELLYGVDYSRDVTDVDSRHSPEMINMISDLGGNPIKRNGFRKIGTRYDKIVYAYGQMLGVRKDNTGQYLTIDKLEYNDGEYNLTATRLYTVWTYCGDINSVVVLRQYLTVLCTNYVAMFNIQTNKVYIQGTTAQSMCVGNLGSTAPVNDVDEIIPTVTIALQPDGTGGTILYGKNIFTIFQRVEFIGDGTSKEFTIPAYTKIGSYVKVETRNSSTGEWENYTGTVTYSNKKTVSGTDLNGEIPINCEIVDAKVTLSTAPAKPYASQPNVRITYAPFSMTLNEKLGDDVYKGYYNEALNDILTSGVATTYNSKLIVAAKNKVYYSYSSNLLLMDDNQWFEVDNDVYIFSRISSYLGIITKDVGTNTIYLASETTETVDSTTGREEVYYTVKPSNAGVGAISKKCFGTLNDEPVFLSTTGIYGILSNYQSEKYAINRSARVNRKLCKEQNLNTAVGVSYNSYFYIAINGTMYVADGRHRDNTKNGDSSYEFYYFNGLPYITDMYVINNVMYFCDDTYIYRWNDDLPDIYKYYDLAELNSDGEWTGIPVKARWCSSLDGDGYPQLVKTLQKKGSVITLATGAETGAELTLNKDGEIDVYVGGYYSKMFSFERIDFSQFSFTTEGVVTDAFMKKKMKKYRRLQIILENNKAQPFGITGIAKAYTIGSLAKPSPAFTKKKG